jgi:hypothetical protein
MIAMTSSMLPWRSVPHPVTSTEEAPPEPVDAVPDSDGHQSRPRPTPTAVADAYAESP